MMTIMRPLAGVAALSLAVLASLHASGQQPTGVQLPKPGVPEIMTLEGKFVQSTVRTFTGYGGNYPATVSLDNPFIPANLLAAAQALHDWQLERDG